MALLAFYLTLALASALLALFRPPDLPRYWPLLAIAAVPQLGGLLGIHIPGMFLLSVSAIVVWCLCNHTVSGVLLIGFGVLLNMLAMALHGGAMPIRNDILATIGVVATPGTILNGSKDIAIAHSPLWWLGDWIVMTTAFWTIVASPGDLVALAGIVWWLVSGSTALKEQPPMMAFQIAPAALPQRQPFLPGMSSRPALTRLALLAAANPTVAETLLRDPASAASSHPHYVLPLDARDRATLDDIRARSRTVSDFIASLADVVDGSSSSH